jgi:5-methylcytosine-specific restriction endonuclease McrA
MAKALWTDDSLGAAKRVGHYLATEVGEGERFNKSTLRTIIPNTEQVDRRMRDLRKVGWVIRNYRDKASLKPNELFLERIGDRVWEDGYKWPEEGLTAAKRRKVLDRDGRRCLVCGLDFGAEYPDRPGVVARPTIGHIVPKERGGTDELDNLRPECQFCNEAVRNLTDLPADVELLKRRVMELRREDKQMLAGWMHAGRRSFSDAEKLWAQYSQLPTPARDEICDVLDAAL